MRMNRLCIWVCLWLPGLALAQTCQYDSIPASAPTGDFERYTDGTALHKTTGLIWKRCLEGQSWNSNTSTCTGDAQLYTWPAALQTAEASNFAGQSDWRLPNIKELQTLVEEACYGPSINLQVFPATSTDYGVWSNSHDAYDARYAWSINSAHGWPGTNYGDYDFYVRLVRGGPEGNESDIFKWPIDPNNVSSGHFGQCVDWENDPGGCYWLSNSAEDSAVVWRDVQPFQLHKWVKGYHLGADYNLDRDKGKPIYPTSAGTVAQVLENQCGWGNIVFLRHDTPWGIYTSMYAHIDWLDSGAPTVGSDVTTDKPIAQVGNGYWNDPNCKGQKVGKYPYHLHFEVREALNTDPGPAYTKQKLADGEKGPQGQIDPNAFVSTH